MAFKSYYKLVKYSKPLPFYVQDVSGSANTVSIVKSNTDAPTLTIETSTDNSTWTTLGQTDTTPLDIQVPANSKVYVRCSADRWSTTSFSSYYNKITSTGNFKAGGNTMSLLYGSSFTGNETVFPNLDHSYTFRGLFYNNTLITDASDLILPATDLRDSIRCYAYMFNGCTSLTGAPALPATILGDACYENMFKGCTALTTAPALPATTIGASCYSSMFEGCTNLTTAPATLPATTMANSCYYSMFKGCTSLTTAPALPATTLEVSCYNSMFQNCYNLTTAPALPATTLAGSCYYNMFCNCTSLTTAPALPATTLEVSCYNSMFLSCWSLANVTCLAEDITASGCTNNWLNGVAATGTFTKSANMSSWPTGDSGIPSGWTVQDAQ